MSKGKKQQYKQFTIRSLEDGCFVLKSLIVPVIVDLEKLKKYSNEAENLRIYNGFIPAEAYEPIHDKVLYQQRELLRFIADHQPSSFSYVDVRQLFVKRKFLRRTLDEESRIILNELLDIRNWSFHNAQSMMVAQLEIAKKSIPEELSDIAEIKPLLNPVVIPVVKSYSNEMLEGFIYHNKIRIGQFEKILAEMKRDYEAMYADLSEEIFLTTTVEGKREIQYINQEITNQDSHSAGSNIASLSMAIQKGKYDGVKENISD